MAAENALKQRMVNEKDRLFQMYHQEKQSLTDIGDHYGCSRQYVQLIFKELGIKRRPRMMALKNRPKRRKSKYNFTEEDDKFILDNFDKMTDTEIALQLGKPMKSIVYRRLIVLGRKKVDRRNFTEEEDQFIIDNFHKMTDIAIARTLNRSLISVTHHRNRILNKPKRSVKEYSQAENGFIFRNYQDMTDKQIAVALRRSKASVAIHRNEVLGLSKTKKQDDE
jgi:hypothetical protein